MEELQPEYPFAEEFSVDFTKTLFPELWRNVKSEARESSKEEIAEEMFYAGAVNMLVFMHGFVDSDEEIEDELEDYLGFQLQECRKILKSVGNC